MHDTNYANAHSIIKKSSRPFIILSNVLIVLQKTMAEFCNMILEEGMEGLNAYTQILSNGKNVILYKDLYNRHMSLL